ncbi:MAG: hypothetical protein HY698_21850 [Deltaproteobacteria bacterium]|nr:hypothetical protein [Deltaproteobacteria bacterium]
MAATDHVLGRPPTTTLLRIGDLVPLGDTTREGLVAVALLIHATVGIGWGATWGILVAFTAHHLAPAAGAFWGAIYGLAAWFVSFFLVLPWIHGELVTHTPARVSILWHATYGAVLGALFHFARIRERERHRITETT